MSILVESQNSKACPTEQAGQKDKTECNEIN